MLRDGEYAAWFRTSRGEGTGIVHLKNGRISGGDTIITYGGCYAVDGDRFTATLTTRRHAAGQSSVFGTDEVELKLVGTCVGTIAFCSGMAEELAGMVFEAALIPRRDQPSAAVVGRSMINSKPNRLLKLPRGLPRY